MVSTKTSESTMVSEVFCFEGMWDVPFYGWRDLAERFCDAPGGGACAAYLPRAEMERMMALVNGEASSYPMWYDADHDGYSFGERYEGEEPWVLSEERLIDGQMVTLYQMDDAGVYTWQGFHDAPPPVRA